MPRRTVATKKIPTRRRTFLKAWREHCGLSLEKVGEKIDFSHASLSRIERGLQDYTGDLLNQLAAVYGADPISLLTRAPDEPESMWELWDQAKPMQRIKIARLAKTLLETEH